MSLIQTISNYILAGKNVPDNNRHFLNWADIKSIFIIAYDNQLADVVDFIDTSKQSNISVTVGIINDGKPEQAPKPSFDHFILNKKQFNWFYIPTEDALKTINQIQYDVLINLSSIEQQKAKALSKLISATCKIGKYEDAIFDVSIVTQIKNNEFLTEVHKYLNMIKTKNGKNS